MSRSLHSKFYILNKGERAVDYFFILSGFLITYLALKELDKSGKFNLRLFLKKRALRIFPLYYLAVFLGFVLIGYLYPLIYGADVFEFSLSEGLLKYILLLPNWMAAEYSNVGPLRSLWSIGVEEQFYIFFPFIMLSAFFRFNFIRNLTILFALFLGLYFLVYFHVVSLEEGMAPFNN